jgi:hypothetical protein
MPRRNILFLIFLFFSILAFAIQPAIRGQAPASALQENTAPARFAYGGNAAQNPAAFIGNLIFLPVRLNQDKPLLFELDSTATATSIDPSYAPHAAASVGGSDAALRNCVLTLPDVALPMSVLAVAGKNDFGLQTGIRYQGTLGPDFFARLVIVVDYFRQTVQLYDPATFTYSGTGNGFPLALAGAAPVVHAKFDIPGRRTQEADFVVSTALDAPIVFYREYTEAHRFSSMHFKTIPASYSQLDAGSKIFLGRLKTFQLGAYSLEEPVAAFSQSNPGQSGNKSVAGAIGAGFLRRFTVIFDLPHQRIIFEPNIQFNKFAEEDMSGLSIVAKGPNLKTFEIAHVQPGTPGASAGVREGDLIAGVDGEPAADMTLSSIRDLFRQVGHKYKLLIERNGKTEEVVIEMKRLI